jgi:hypothetical protein
MRRSALAMVILTVVLVPARGMAGGSWLQPERPGYGVGEIATLRTTFYSGSLEGTIADGPYVAYLLPIGSTGIDDPDAIPVGEIEMRPVSGTGIAARVTFTVPHVPTGWYVLEYCNDPCTVDGIGDLVGGQEFFIAPSAIEGVLRARIDRLVDRVSFARTNGRRGVARLEATLEARTAELAAARAAARRPIPPPATVVERRAAPEESSVTWWITLLGCALGLAAGVAIGRRRRGAEIVVPDTVPDDFVDRERAVSR